ncbi:MAG: sigma-70 family RNA polymerase sigma factor [Clostridia bacterium]|nr:sigma-70 family RNA polymerase sigma factor [Clostridia bacterium]
MLDYTQTAKLLLQAKEGNQQAKETLLVENTPLLKSIIKRFYNKGVEYDDLFQLASMGFIKAIKNFDFTYNVKFSTYAVPMITGEIKRFLRDDGYIKVSRSLKVLYNKIYKYLESCRNKGGEPTIEEIASHLSVSSDDVILAMECVKMPISLFEKSDDGNERSLNLIDKLIINDNTEDTVEKIVLKTILSELTVREKKIIMLRYFRDMTQSEVAKILNVSQVQISRLETKILEKIKLRF